MPMRARQKRMTAQIRRPQRHSPAQYCRCIDLARQDLLKNRRPRLQSYPENLDACEEIFLGFPNYWGTMPAPVFSFLEHVDLAGKIIRPFCTYEDSGFGHSLEDLRRACPGALVKEGLALRGADVADEVRNIVRWACGQ